MRFRRLILCSLLVAAGPMPASGQDPALRQAAARVQAAWLVHDVESLLDADSLTLRLRGGDDEAGAIPRTQGVRILRGFLRPASEVAFDIRTVRAAGPGQAYAEGSRRYVVSGTSDPLVETVLLGFRLASGRWQLTEIRVTP
ncbi:MAG: hypothetical protein EXR93_00825 [Gemmatimonadetes bacterium]|nr:hypothetical protein [Gemmatimonadota bacterium]